MADPTREDLIALCDRGVVLQKHWHNRDSAEAQMQLGKCRALLLAGCDFRIEGDEAEFTKSDAETWWVEVTFEGFNYHEFGERQTSTFYVPTAARLDKYAGADWY